MDGHQLISFTTDSKFSMCSVYRVKQKRKHEIKMQPGKIQSSSTQNVQQAETSRGETFFSDSIQSLSKGPSKIPRTQSLPNIGATPRETDPITKLELPIGSRPIRNTVKQHTFFGVSKNLGKTVGVPLAKRIEIGDRGACKILLAKLGHKPSDIKDKLAELIELIEKNRRLEPLSQVEIDRKINLQKMISEEM